MFRKTLMLTILLAALPITSRAQDTGPIAPPTAEDGARSDPRITGGRPVSESDKYQFTASLRVDDKHSCGGAFVAPRVQGGRVLEWGDRRETGFWLLTARHCMFYRDTGKKIPEESMKVVGGRRDFSKGNTGAYIFDVEDINVPPPHKGDEGYLSNDIALLQLSPGRLEPADGTAEFEPLSIPLPSRSMIAEIYQERARLVVNGWGLTSSDGFEASQVLRTTIVPYVSREVCQQHYETLGAGISKTSFCAGWATGGADACGLDSGGPIFFDGETSGLYLADGAVLAGLVSWGSGCGRANFEGVYTNVAALKPWIEKVVAAKSTPTPDQ